MNILKPSKQFGTLDYYFKTLIDMFSMKNVKSLFKITLAFFLYYLYSHLFPNGKRPTIGAWDKRTAGDFQVFTVLGCA